MFDKKISHSYQPNPPGRGSLRSMPIDFSTDSNSGTVHLTFPLNLTKSRALTPQLSLNYHSNQGNSVFGLGFDLAGVLRISRSTKYGVPIYNDNEDKFILSNAGELVKTEEKDNVIIYRPRIDTQFARIEYYPNEKYWIIREANGINHFLGREENNNSRVSDGQSIFQWSVCVTEDAYGNKIHYQYKKDVLVATPQSTTSQTFYLSEISYGNYSQDNSERFAFRCVFDYGEEQAPGENSFTAQPLWNNAARIRPDRFTDYKAGFPTTINKLCQRILLYHQFDERIILAKYWELTYKAPESDFAISMLAQIQEKACRSHSDGSYLMQSLPPARFKFRGVEPEKSTFESFNLGTTLLPEVGGTYQWMDLYRDGLPGILYHDGNTALYWRSEADGKFSAPKVLAPYPKQIGLSGNIQSRMMHLGLEKKTAMVLLNGEEVGYYLLDDEAYEETSDTLQVKFSKEMKFKQLPFSFADPMSEVIDLNGSGRNDLLILNAQYPHFFVEENAVGGGYKKPQPLLNLPRNFPRNPFDPNAWVSFIDIFGDGLLHRVKVSRDGIDIWPNVGHGKFLNAIHWNLPLTVEEINTFDPARVFFADIDGSGASDFIYASSSSVSVFLNLGTKFSKIPQTLLFPERYTHHDQLLFGDFLGQGVSSVILIKRNVHKNHYYMGSFTKRKPYMLSEMIESSGLITTLDYSTTVASYRHDRKNLPPIKIRLPFVLPVLASTTVVDPATCLTVKKEYHYHHGVYDHLERSFCGFAYVEEHTFGSLTDLTGIVLATPIENGIIKSWFYNRAQDQAVKQYPGFVEIPSGTSTFINGEIAQHYFKEDENGVEFELSTIPEFFLKREAQFTLRGQLLRQEHWGEGKDAPISVLVQNYTILGASSPAKNTHRVFVIQKREYFKIVYQQRAEEPRITRDLYLSFDQYNNNLETLSIAYGRREVFTTADDFVDIRYLNTSILSEVNPLLMLNHVLLRNAKFFFINDKTFIFLHLPQELFLYDLSQVIGASSLQSFNEIKQRAKSAARELMKQKHYFYWNDALSDVAEFGLAGNKALLHHQESLLGNSAQVHEWYQSLLQSAEDMGEMLEHGGFSTESDSLGNKVWWQASLVNYYGDARQYYQLVEQRSLTNNAANCGLLHRSIFKRDSYELAIIEEESFLSYKENEVDVEKSFLTRLEIDYVTMQACQIVDHNQNTTIILYDALGQVIAHTKYGQLQEKTIGNPVEIPTPLTKTRLSDLSFEFCKKLYDATISAILANPTEYLGTWLRVNYYAPDQSPRIVLELTQNNYKISAQAIVHNDSTSIGVSIHYVDDSGNPLQSRHQTDERAPEQQWLSSGLRIHNKEGVLLWQSLPSYGDTPNCDNAIFPGQENILFNQYTANFDLKMQVLPSDDKRKIVTTPWYEIFYDQNNNSDQEVAASYVIRFINAQENVIAHLRQSKVDGNQYTLATTQWDVLGRIILQQDTRLTEPNLVITYNLLGQIVIRHSADRGTEYYLYNNRETLARKRLGKWSLFYDVDSWQRTLATSVYSAGMAPIQIESRTYGESLNSPETMNACGQVVKHVTEEGFVDRKFFDLMGCCVQHVRNIYLPAMTQGIQDSFNLDTGPRGIHYKTSPAVEANWRTDKFEFLEEYGPHGNLIVQRLPISDGFATANSYNRLAQVTKIEAGLLASNANITPGTLETTVADLSYNELGCIAQLQLGNSLSTRMIYNQATQRLKQVHTMNNRNSKVVQDEKYFYDPVGNLILMQANETRLDLPDGTQTMFPATALQHAYDDFYRLKRSEGLELVSQGITANSRHFPHHVMSEQNDLQVYNQQFSYDQSGNLISMSHNGVENWRLDYEIEEDSNRFSVLTKADNTRLIPDDENPLYDSAGNMQKLDADTKLHWDHTHQLRQVTIEADSTENESTAVEDINEFYAYRGTAFQDVGFADEVGSQAKTPFNMGFFGKSVAAKFDSKPFAEYGSRLYKITCFQKGANSIEVIEQVFLGNYERKQVFSIPRQSAERSVTQSNFIRHTVRISAGDTPLATYHQFELDTLAQEAERPVLSGHAPLTQWQYHLSNQLHSHVLDFNALAQVLSAEGYQPYGQFGFILVSNNNQLRLKDYHYSNQMHDEISGLYYYGARYYAPQFGRWLSPDPAGLIDTLNLYAFVGNNPLTNIDTFGLAESLSLIDNIGPNAQNSGATLLSDSLLDTTIAGNKRTGLAFQRAIFDAIDSEIKLNDFSIVKVGRSRPRIDIAHDYINMLEVKFFNKFDPTKLERVVQDAYSGQLARYSNQFAENLFRSDLYNFDNLQHVENYFNELGFQRTIVIGVRASEEEMFLTKMGQLDEVLQRLNNLKVNVVYTVADRAVLNLKPLAPGLSSGYLAAKDMAAAPSLADNALTVVGSSLPDGIYLTAAAPSVVSRIFSGLRKGLNLGLQVLPALGTGLSLVELNGANTTSEKVEASVSLASNLLSFPRVSAALSRVSPSLGGAGGVLGAGLMGVQLGSYLDKKLGISEYMTNVGVEMKDRCLIDWKGSEEVCHGLGLAASYAAFFTFNPYYSNSTNHAGSNNSRANGTGSGHTVPRPPPKVKERYFSEHADGDGAYFEAHGYK